MAPAPRPSPRSAASAPRASLRDGPPRRAAPGGTRLPWSETPEHRLAQAVVGPGAPGPRPPRPPPRAYARALPIEPRAGARAARLDRERDQASAARARQLEGYVATRARPVRGRRPRHRVVRPRWPRWEGDRLPPPFAPGSRARPGRSGSRWLVARRGRAVPAPSSLRSPVRAATRRDAQAPPITPESAAASS